MLTVVELTENAADRWHIVNDDVMGGVSRSRISFDEAGATFEGRLSRENEGGFAWVRTSLERTDLSECEGIAVRAEGGGDTFQLRLRTDDAGPEISYRARFRAPEGDVRMIRVPFSGFEPMRRGRAAPEAGPLDPSRVVQLGFLIADGQEGPFRLRFEWIGAYRDSESEVR